ncbi:hypothetical protein J6590_014040 [Homalodisca vitripennis]|nr:hypothetical protein J6590_014040 [Homalodisca vitripennis]
MAGGRRAACKNRIVQRSPIQAAPRLTLLDPARSLKIQEIKQKEALNRELRREALLMLEQEMVVSQ